MLLANPLMIVFIAYILIIWGIAYASTRITNNLSDYVLAGRRLSGPITALGAGASDMSSWLLIAVPGSVYEFGLSMIWLPIALIIGAYCNWRFMSKRLRVYTEIANDSLTIPDFIANRFRNNGFMLRVAVSLVIIIFFTYYSAAGLRAGAMLLENTFAINYFTALMITTFVIVVYTGIGGFLAVSRIDFFQGFLMFLALLVVPIVTVLSLGGLGEVIRTVNNHSLIHMNAFNNTTVLGFLSLFAWGFGYFGQLHINTRFMAIRSTKELPLARLICLSWMSIALFSAIGTGLAGYAYYINNPLKDSNTVFIDLAHNLFNPWLTGVLLSAVIAATMSNVSAQILMSASIIVKDFYHNIFRKNASDKENILASRFIVLIVAGIAITVAANPTQSIFKAVAFAWSGLGAAFGPTLLFSLYWRRMTHMAAICGIISGALSVFIIHFSFIHPDLLGGFELLPSFIISSLIIYVVGLKSAMPAKDVLCDFDKFIERLEISNKNPVYTLNKEQYVSN